MDSLYRANVVSNLTNYFNENLVYFRVNGLRVPRRNFTQLALDMSTQLLACSRIVEIYTAMYVCKTLKTTEMNFS
jgi:hypothetical protein